MSSRPAPISGSDGSDANMNFVNSITGISADAYGTSAWVPNDMPMSAALYLYVPTTQVPTNMAGSQLLGTGKNIMFFAPPQAGDRKLFQRMDTSLQQEQEDEEARQGPLVDLFYKSAKAAADAKRNTTTSWEQVSNPSFPTTDAHDQIYVIKLMRACSDFSRGSPGDSEDALKRFTKILQDNPARVEQACWSVLEEVKLRHIANANEYRASGEFKFAGNFEGHITSLCEDLFAVNKTACKTICSNCNGLAAIVDNPGKRKLDTENNHDINKGREYQAKAKKPRKKRRTAAATTTTTTAAVAHDGSAPTMPAPADAFDTPPEQAHGSANVFAPLPSPEEAQDLIALDASGPAHVLNADSLLGQDFNDGGKRKRDRDLPDFIDPADAPLSKRKRALPADAPLRKLKRARPAASRSLGAAAAFPQEDVAPDSQTEPTFGSAGTVQGRLPPTAMEGPAFADYRPPHRPGLPLSDATRALITESWTYDKPNGPFATSGASQMDALAASILPESIAPSYQRPNDSRPDSPGGQSATSEERDWEYYDRLLSAGTDVPPMPAEQASGAGAAGAFDGFDEIPDWDEYVRNYFKMS